EASGASPVLPLRWDASRALPPALHIALFTCRAVQQGFRLSLIESASIGLFLLVILFIFRPSATTTGLGRRCAKCQFVVPFCIQVVWTICEVRTVCSTRRRHCLVGLRLIRDATNAKQR